MTPVSSLRVEISYDAEMDVIRIQTDGPLDQSSLLSLFDAAAAASKVHHCRRFLADHRASPLKLDAAQIYFVPENLAEHGVVHHRAALIFQEIGNDEKFLETVCANRRVTVKVFTDPDYALAWLTDE